jgi:hypothetical protein
MLHHIYASAGIKRKKYTGIICKISTQTNDVALLVDLLVWS